MCQSLFVNLSIRRWTRKIVFLLSWSLNSTPNPSIQCNYTVPHSTWKIWAAPGAKVLFLNCWNDCNTLTYDISLTSCKQLIAPNSLALQKQPDLQVFTCFHSSSIPLLPFISPSISLLPLAISLSPPQVWPWIADRPLWGLVGSRAAKLCLEPRANNRATTTSIGTLPTEAPVTRWYFKSGHQSTLLGPYILLKSITLFFLRTSPALHG